MVNKPDYNGLRKLRNVHTLILDSLYAKQDGKTPSEKVAKEMLRDVLLGTDSRDKAIIITTFSSHIARLKSIIEESKKLKRKIVFFGRSLNRYVGAAQDAGLIDFRSGVEIVAYGNKIRKKLAVINKEGSDKYIIVCTGNQAEPGSALVKMAEGILNFKFHNEDMVIFSCRTIPVEENIKAREKLESKLKKLGCRIFTNIHVSGHSYIEDDRELIKILNPRIIIPAHGGREITLPAEDLASGMGYKHGKTIFILKNGEILDLV